MTAQPAMVVLSSMFNSLPKPWLQNLLQGCEGLQIELTHKQAQQICQYVQALQKWNKTYNLTAITDLDAMLKLHVLDSLSIAKPLLPYLSKRIIDVGTGAGLPGILLAIIWPQQQVTLLDTNGKKTRFLLHCKHLLALNNVTVVNQRVEQYQPQAHYDVVVSRAFAAINDMLMGCQHLLTNQGIFAAMKGQYPNQEVTQMPSQFKVQQSIALSVPYIEAERHLLVIQGQ